MSHPNFGVERPGGSKDHFKTLGRCLPQEYLGKKVYGTLIIVSVNPVLQEGSLHDYPSSKWERQYSASGHISESIA